MPPDDATGQLPLALPFEERRGAEDFFVSASNAAAHAALEAWPDGWADPLLVLVGPEGAGKTHLASIWADRAGAWRRTTGPIDLRVEPGLLTERALLIEDVDRDPPGDAALFHLINAARERQAAMLLTARRPPAAWGVQAPDLLSRLRRAPIVEIAAPDDELLRALLVKLFMDRQLAVDTRVIDTIISRAERSFAVMRAIVDALDLSALAAGRRITRAMAQEAAERLSPPREVES